ncbi:MAG: cation:proton antiporter [Candidatus Thorarchaeota archaeon]
MIGLLLLLGAALVLSVVGAFLMKKVGFPQILGFMLAGVILGIFQIFDDGLWESLYPLIDLALGLIGYNIGLEIRKEVFTGKTRQMGTILILESILTFIVVSLLANWILGQWHIAIVFGALASATDPASTVMVIWERKTKGNLTDTLMFVLALDDVVAIMLANISISIAVLVYSAPGTVTILSVVAITVFDLVTSAVIGGGIGFAMVYIINREADRGRLLELELGLVLLLVGVMSAIGINAILACMIFGFIVGNYVDDDKEPISDTLKIIMAPIVMIFFVMVGASLDIAALASATAILLAVLYVVGRTFAKYSGSFVGGKITNAPPRTTKYLGFCLMSQAGIAVGLSLVVNQHFSGLGVEAAAAGLLIVNVIALTTMILQLFGPIAASEGLIRAGEAPVKDGEFSESTTYLDQIASKNAPEEDDSQHDDG